jgi:SpoVK/Ycf46/Vps4 family AAA+-type ATPase
MATALREAFVNLMELEAAVVFIDEVEEIAGSRSAIPSDPAHVVTNELLKLIPAFRQHDERLLICATNSVRSLDSAFLRPGRFDYIIPVGPPDDEARAAIWKRYLGRHRRIGRGRQAGRSERDVHPRRYRVRGPKGRSVSVRA